MKSSRVGHERVVFTAPSCVLLWKMDNTTVFSVLESNELHLPSGRVWSQVICLFSVAAGLQHWAGSCRSECRPACETALRTGYHPPPALASSLQPSSYGHAMLWNTHTHCILYIESIFFCLSMNQNVLEPFLVTALLV